MYFEVLPTTTLFAGYILTYLLFTCYLLICEQIIIGVLACQHFLAYVLCRSSGTSCLHMRTSLNKAFLGIYKWPENFAGSKYW